MSVSIVDAIVVLFILLGAVVGFKHGVVREGVYFVGIIVAFVLAFLFKDSLMVLLYENLPFFNFLGPIRGLDAINVLLYQFLAFLFIFILLYFVLRVLLVITGLIELLLKITVFFSLPSKILGIFVGALEYYVYVFIVLYILNMPVLNLSLVNESKFGNAILTNTPVLSGMVDNTVTVYTDVWNIIRNRGDRSHKEVNTLVLATLLDNKLITVESAKRLVNANKIIITDPSILDEYEDDGNWLDNMQDKYNFYID